MKRYLRLMIALAVVLLAAIIPAHSAMADAPQLDGLTYLGETPLQYAECFHLYCYEGGYTLISIPESGEYLVVPQGATVPKGLDNSITVLQQPLDRIYLAATSAMALFDAVDAVDSIRFSGTQASGWYIESAIEALNSGAMQFAGRYSEPDYERLCFDDCNLAIESTMIYHTPKVKERLEALDIPVLVDRSSYEPHPLGRTEWVKLYAVLVGKEAEAEAFFDAQANVVRQLEEIPNTGKTIAYFYVNSDGSVIVRNPVDYIPQLLEIGGGKYLCPALSEKETGTAIAVTMESFYAAAWNADILIYNSSIDVPLESIQQLIAKDSLFADFTAVQQGNVWCSGKSFYQETDIVCQMAWDVHNVLQGAADAEMTFLTQVK